MVGGPRSKHLGPLSMDLEPWIVDRVPRFKLRGSCLEDAEQLYLGWLRDLDRRGSRGGVYVESACGLNGEWLIAVERRFVIKYFIS